MPIHGELPGTPPGGPEPTLEWVSPGAGIVPALRARLGSGARAETLLAAVMACMRSWLQPDTLDAAVDELPWPVRAAVRSPGGLPTVPRLASSEGFIATVGELAQRTPAQAAFCVRAVFATLRTHLARGLADAIEKELPAEIAELWRDAR